jgi:hypothetical protein
MSAAKPRNFMMDFGDFMGGKDVAAEEVRDERR